MEARYHVFHIADHDIVFLATVLRYTADADEVLAEAAPDLRVEQLASAAPHLRPTGPSAERIRDAINRRKFS